MGPGLEPGHKPGCLFSLWTMVYEDALGHCSHGLTVMREAGPVRQYAFCPYTTLLLSPEYLASKGAAGPTAGTRGTRCAGIADAETEGLITSPGHCMGAARQLAVLALQQA